VVGGDVKMRAIFQRIFGRMLMSRPGEAYDGLGFATCTTAYSRPAQIVSYGPGKKNKGRGIEPNVSCHVRPERASYGHGVSHMAVFAGHEYDREEAIQLGTSGVSRYRRHGCDGDGIKLCQISIP
jgi:hypothetical protein